MKVSRRLLSPPLKVMGVICFQFWNLKRKSNAAAVTTPFAVIWASRDQKEAFHPRANPVNLCLCAGARWVIRIKRPEDTFMRALSRQFSRSGSVKARFGLKRADILGICVYDGTDISNLFEGLEMLKTMAVWISNCTWMHHILRNGETPVL